jgi:hypothetical protein
LNFQLLFFFSFFSIISAQPSSSSSSSDAELTRFRPPIAVGGTGRSWLGPPTGLIVTEAVDVLLGSCKDWGCGWGGGGEMDERDDLRRSSVHGFNVIVVNVDERAEAMLFFVVVSWIVETGLYRDAMPMLLRSEGVIEGA